MTFAGKDYGCRGGEPHDYVAYVENLAYKLERCIRCGKQIYFNKDKYERIDNDAYLEAHTRNFAQPYGRTARLWYALWHPELYKKNRGLWAMSVCVADECWIGGIFHCKHGDIERRAELPDLAQKGTNANG